MQFTKPFKEKIRAGDVTVSFRAWSGPRVKIGGVYRLHPTGAVRVTAMARISSRAIAPRDAEKAGFDSAEALREFLQVGLDDEIYRVGFEFVPDADVPVAPAMPLETVVGKLAKMEARSARPWAYAALRLIDAKPGVRAGDLAPEFQWETPRFKANVRKLKKLGLTESLEVGYRLSPLGREVIAL